jgi:hypothetical protein
MHRGATTPICLGGAQVEQLTLTESIERAKLEAMGKRWKVSKFHIVRPKKGILFMELDENSFEHKMCFSQSSVAVFPLALPDTGADNKHRIHKEYTHKDFYFVFSLLSLDQTLIGLRYVESFNELFVLFFFFAKNPPTSLFEFPS